MTDEIRVRCETCLSEQGVEPRLTRVCPSRTPGCGHCLPTGFYDTPALRATLARYDLGPVFRAVRAELGLSQVTLAMLVRQPQTEVSKIERGARAVRDVAVMARIARSLDIPGHLLGFGPDPSASAAAEEDWLQRRTFIHGITALVSVGVSGIGAPAQAEAFISGQRPSRIDMSHVEAVEKATAELREWDNAGPTQLWLTLMEAQLDHVQAWRSASCTDDVQARAQVAAADVASLVAWMHYDRGDGGQARRRWADALRYAMAADHPRASDLAVTVLLDMAHHELHATTYRDALWLTNLAGGLAETSRFPVTPTTRAYIAATRAWCHAHLGDVKASLRALDTAQQGYADANPHTAPPWAAPGGQAEISAQVGHTLHLLSATNPMYAEPSLAHLTTAIGQYGDPFARSRTMNLPGLACSLFRVGDIEAAVHTGREAVTAAMALGVPRSAARLSGLATVAEPHASHSDVRDLCHQISKAVEALA